MNIAEIDFINNVLIETSAYLNDNKKYFLYDILTDTISNISFEEYNQLKELGAISNLVPDETFIRTWIEEIKNKSNRYIRVVSE